MTSLRPLTEDGFGAKKVALLGADGEPLREPSGKICYRLWAGDKEVFLEQRQTWLDLQNRHLALAGLDVRVDGRSYQERGLDILPTTHIGVGAAAMKRKAGGQADGLQLERLALHEARRRINAARIRARPSLVLEMIEAERSVFDARDVAKILHRYIDDAASFEQLMLRILQNPDCVRLEEERIDPATGARCPAKFATRSTVRLEAEMVNRASSLSQRSSHGVKEHLLETVLARHAHLSAEQRVAIGHVTANGRMAAVVGRAGAGKTTMMRAAREAWQVAGFRVVGAALAGKAAEGLMREAGIPGFTLAAWELAWKEGRHRLDAQTIVVLDEAGMVASRQMAGLIETVSKAGAKLVLVGDADQLQPIEAGAAFRAIASLIGYVELQTIYRQKHDWMRSASLDLATGNIGAALDAYGAHGQLKGSSLKADAIRQLIDDWDKAYDPAKSTLILAHLRRDVKLLNELARERLVTRGLIDQGVCFRTEEGERQFARGDQIVFLKNEASLGVRNGMLATVEEAGPGRIVAAIGEGSEKRRIEVDQRFYNNLDHGYATTIHKSQGATVDRVMVLATLSLDRHLAYVALTRHRDDVSLYYGQQSFARAGGLTRVLSRRAAKETTLDYARSRFYGEALRFANARGLHLMRVARSLLRDHACWMLRQKEQLERLGQKLQSLAGRFGLTYQAPREPLLKGISSFALSALEAAEARLQADAGLSALWEALSKRLRSIYADPEGAFSAIDFAALITGKAEARGRLQHLEQSPEVFGPLRGSQGLLASRTERDERKIAEQNAPALLRDIERYLSHREKVLSQAIAEEERERSRLAVDIPALSPAATRLLESIAEAIERADPEAAVRLASTNPAKGEIEAFAQAVAARFGERSLLPLAAREAHGPTFEAAALHLTPRQKQMLVRIWPYLCTAQQLAAHERTTKALQETNTQKLTQQQRPVLRP